MTKVIDIKDIAGNTKGTLELNSAIFESDINLYTIRESLCQFQANQRRGTHATKTFGMVSGGGKKPWKQKGTGRARTSSIRNPLWRKGGTIFGPQPRDYSFKVNRKKKRSALKGALTDLAQNNKVVVLSEINLESPKTKNLTAVLKTLNIPESGLVLILTPEKNENLYLAGRNLPTVKVSPVENINIYDLLTCDYLVTTADGIKKIEENLE